MVVKYNFELKKDTPLADRKNMTYMMTMVSRGRGLGVVVRTGITTEVGNNHNNNRIIYIIIFYFYEFISY